MAVKRNGFIRKTALASMLVKEFKQALRDKRMVLMLFGSPILMMLVFGYAVNTDVNRVKVAVLDEDKSSLSRIYLRKFFSGTYFEPHIYIESSKQMDRLLDRSEVDMFMHLRGDFSRKVRAGKNTEVQIIIDGTDSSRASVILSYVTQINNGFSFDYFGKKVSMVVRSRQTGLIKMKEPIGLQERSLFNPDLKSRHFYLPGVLAAVIALITIMLTSMSVVKERESGTIEQIIVSPLKPVEFVLGKILPFAIIGFADIIVITLITITWFEVPFRGSFFFLLFTSILYIMCTLAVGLYISTISQTQQQAVLSTFIFFIPSILLSGFVFPIYAMPQSVQLLTLANPMRYFITIIRAVFLKGVGIVVLWKQVSALFVIGTTLLYMSIKRSSRRIG